MVNDIHMYIYRVTLTAELMSNDTKFARVTKERREERKPFHTLDRVWRAAKKMRRKKN